MSYYDDEAECDDEPGYDPEYDDEDGPRFADPGGRSALRAATHDNPRDQPCPYFCETPTAQSATREDLAAWLTARGWTIRPRTW